VHIDRSLAAGTVIAYHAGSLQIPFTKIARAFEMKHPGVTVNLVSGGSVDLARQLQRGEVADVYASADYGVIRDLRPYLTSWYALFARNRMVLGYVPGAKGSESIGVGNWFQVILRPDVKFGHTDPDGDPAGYRTLQVAKLAEAYHGHRGLFEAFLKAPGRRVYAGERMTDIRQDVKNGKIDYAFLYASTAAQLGLKAVIFPPEIDLSDPALAKTYAQAKIVTKGTSGDVERVGEPIVYGVTVLRAAQRADLAQAFVDFLLSEEGATALKEAGLEPLIPVQIVQ
jgi:molybdate/tungstate transport system substrate-binding protein